MQIGKKLTGNINHGQRKPKPSRRSEEIKLTKYYKTIFGK